MRTALIRGMRRRLAARRTQEGGYFVILLAILVSSGFMFAAAASSVDVSRWYSEMNDLQKAADAAALSGVPYMPYDLASATSTAIATAKRNGYDDAASNVQVVVEQGDLASQLKVTIYSTISNSFGGMIGVPKTTLSRSATADYKGPAPMGSPCNAFGNEPTSGSGAAAPTGSAQGSGKFSNCSTTPQFWAAVEGPETDKIQGDRYQTKGCQGGEDGCSGTTNSEYDPFGYVFLVKVQSAMVGKQISLQLYDPEFAYTGQSCEVLPTSSSWTARNLDTQINPYSTYRDAQNRYAADGGSSDSFCTGDSWPGENVSSASADLTTTFVLRQQVDSQDPTAAPVQTDTAGANCVKQYGSYAPDYSRKNNPTRAWGTDVLTSGSGTYSSNLAQTFHNWVNFCTFTPARAGDYYLQVRTNVAPSSSALISSGNVTTASAATGNTSTGEGSNAFAIRAVTPTGYEQQVAVSGYSHMPIYVNSDAATTTFNLLRVLPGAAGQYITFSYFDAGDAQSSGYVQVTPPTDATGSIKTTPFPNGGCKAQGGSAPSTATAISNCKASIDSANDGSNTSKNNGKVETLTIPIPTDYTCNYNSLGGCWYQVTVSFGSGSVHDQTTWDATIVGDPVRLIK